MDDRDYDTNDQSESTIAMSHEKVDFDAIALWADRTTTSTSPSGPSPADFPSYKLPVVSIGERQVEPRETSEPNIGYEYVSTTKESKTTHKPDQSPSKEQLLRQIEKELTEGIKRAVLLAPNEKSESSTPTKEIGERPQPERTVREPGGFRKFYAAGNKEGLVETFEDGRGYKESTFSGRSDKLERMSTEANGEVVKTYAQGAAEGLRSEVIGTDGSVRSSYYKDARTDGLERRDQQSNGSSVEYYYRGKNPDLIDQIHRDGNRVTKHYMNGRPDHKVCEVNDGNSNKIIYSPGRPDNVLMTTRFSTPQGDAGLTRETHVGGNSPYTQRDFDGRKDGLVAEQEDELGWDRKFQPQHNSKGKSGESENKGQSRIVEQYPDGTKKIVKLQR